MSEPNRDGSEPRSQGLLWSKETRIAALLLSLALALCILGVATGVFKPSDLLFPQPTPARAASATPGSTPTSSPGRKRTPTPPPALDTPTTAPATVAPRSGQRGPTPIVCADPAPDALSGLALAPGQPFQCTFSEGYLTELLGIVPDLPCSDARVFLDEGLVALTCKVFLTVRVEGVVEAVDCRPVARVTGGTAGIAETVQEMIDSQVDAFAWEAVCFEQVAIDDGRITVWGYGR